MAILGKIRKNPWLLILGIGLPLLAFLVGDAFSKGSIFGDPNELGSINGESIKIQDYNEAYNKLSKDPRLQGASQNLISDQAWNQLIQERIINDEAEKAGITFTDNQYYQMAGMFFSSVNPNLVNEKGQANVESVKQFLSQLQAAAKGGNQQAAYFYEQWLNFNPQFSALRNEFISMVSSGILATKSEVEFSTQTKSVSSEINYVMANYSDYAKANKITVTDEDVKNYLGKYKKQFKKEPTVNLAYAYFAANPSASDKAKFDKKFNAFLNTQIIENEEKGTKDTIPSFSAAVNDSAYVTRYSESGFDPTYYTRDQIEQSTNQEVKNAILSNLSKGSVVGPFHSNNVYQLIKVSDVKPISDSIKSSHILISFAGAQGSKATRTQQKAKSIADSLLTVIKANPAKFNELATTISDDKVSSKENGSIGWVYRFQQNFEPSYLDFLMNNAEGSVDVVASGFGYHIIRIDDVKQKMGYRLARLQKEMIPSDDTQQEIFNKSSKVAVNSKDKTVNDFINNARKEGGEVSTETGLTRFQAALPGLEQTKKESDILSWAFNRDTKPGTIQRFETVEGGQIVVYLNAKFSDDEYNLTAYKELVEPFVLHEKVLKSVEAKVGNKTNMNEIAKLLNSTVKKASGITYYNANLAGIGVEPNVGAAAFGLPKGKTSGAIKGVNGIFFIQTTSKTLPSKASSNDDMEKRALRSINASMMQQRLIPSFIQASDLVDKRADKLVH